ncbi:MAG: hypothetical protein HS100_10315 [Anaerolineales bacterium]|nr:hypothetical protein [Anaerolineales bacterium]
MPANPIDQFISNYLPKEQTMLMCRPAPGVEALADPRQKESFDDCHD